MIWLIGYLLIGLVIILWALYHDYSNNYFLTNGMVLSALTIGTLLWPFFTVWCITESGWWNKPVKKDKE